jgi:hypothetical protein
MWAHSEKQPDDARPSAGPPGNGTKRRHHPAHN